MTHLGPVALRCPEVSALTLVTALHFLILFASVAGTECVGTQASHVASIKFQISSVSSSQGLVFGSIYCIIIQISLSFLEHKK